MEEFVVNTAIPITIGLVILAAAIAVFFGIIQSLFNPKGALKSIVTVALLAAVIFGVYSMAPSEVSGIFKTSKYTELGVTPFVMKYTYTAIIASLVLIAIAFLSWIILELVNLVR